MKVKFEIRQTEKSRVLDLFDLNLNYFKPQTKL